MQSLSANTGIEPPLVSRFDLIFLMIEPPSDIERHVHITEHLLNAAIKGDAHFTGTR